MSVKNKPGLSVADTEREAIDARIAERPSHWEDPSKYVLIMPAILFVLFLAVFPLLLSVFTSLSRITFVKGGFKVTYVGLDNYRKLLADPLGGSPRGEQRHFMGRLIDPKDINIWGWIALALAIAFLLYWLYRYITGPHRRAFGIVMRALTALIALTLIWIAIRNLAGPRAFPGTLVVTLIFVYGGVALQYALGLALAMLVTQNLPGRRFFRVVFLLPMMITPVGIGFLFRMIMDTILGPLSPIWKAAGLANMSWVDNPSVARLAIIVGDTWQWTPFVFIILLAGLEGLPTETVEAALVDGANRVQMFRFIILPQIIPVSTTVILIRMIEAFKLIDMPQALTRGGPGTATESMTLHAYNLWRAIDLGTSSALAYLMLFVVTFMALVFVNFIRARLLETI
jgi:multiple sugar transport system permease protein